MDFESQINISDAMQIILAIAALIIAIIECARYYKEQKEQKMRVSGIKDILSKISNLESLADQYKMFYNCVASVQKSVEALKQDPKELSEKQLVLIPALLNTYKKGFNTIIESTDVYNSLNSIYKLMLQYEDKFSMSYGYSRYIEVLGEFDDRSKELQQTQRSLFDILDRCDPEKPKEFPRPEEFVKVLNNCYHITEKYFTSFRKVVFSIGELKIKYERC